MAVQLLVILERWESARDLVWLVRVALDYRSLFIMSN